MTQHYTRRGTATERHAHYVDRISTPDGCWLWTGNQVFGYGTLGIGSRLDGTAKIVKAHRFALEQRLGRPIAPTMMALHTCDVRACQRNDGEEGTYEINGVVRVRFGHLWEGTHDDNMADRNAKGRQASGDQNGSRLHPERLARGDKNGSRLHPERVARGDRHSSRTRRDARPRGERHHRAKLTQEQVQDILRRGPEKFGAPAALAREYGVSKTTISHILKHKIWQHIHLEAAHKVTVQRVASGPPPFIESDSDESCDAKAST